MDGLVYEGWAGGATIDVEVKPQRICEGLIIGVFACAGIRAQVTLRISTPVTRYQTILIAEIEEVNYPSGPPELAADIRARVRISRIMKDNLNLGLKPMECDVTIRRPTGRVGAGNGNWWIGRTIQAGQRYIFFSDAKADPPAIIAEPFGGEELMDGIDSVGDIEQILNSRMLSITDQVRNAVLVLEDSRQHSDFFAQYVAALLDAGSDVETVPLVDLIAGGGDSAFSGQAKESLLFWLYDHSRSPMSRVPPMPGEPPGPANDNLTRVFASLVVRYFGEGPKDASLPPTPVQRQILARYAPFLRTSDHASAVFRRLLISDIAKIQDAAFRCISDRRLTEKEKSEARELVRLLVQ